MNQGVRFRKDPLPSNLVYNFKTPFEEYNFKTKDNAVINAVLFKAAIQPAKGVIYFFHGNGGNMLRYAKFTLEVFPFGYDIMVIDYRGFGKSIGKTSERAFYEDSQMVYNFLRNKYKPEKIYLIGHSFGCTIAAYIASKNPASALVLIGPLYSFIDAQKNCPWYYPKITEYFFRTDVYVKKSKSPVYIFTGSTDVIHEASLRLGKLLKKGDKLIIIGGGNHTDIFYDETNFRSNIKKILKVEDYNAFVNR